MSDQPEESKAASDSVAQQCEREQAAQGLQMAELSRRAVLAPGSSNHESAPQAETSSGLPGVDPALLDPQAMLPPHVTRAAAALSCPPAVHEVDKPCTQE